jgi:hypothetical protein
MSVSSFSYSLIKIVAVRDSSFDTSNDGIGSVNSSKESSSSISFYSSTCAYSGIISYSYVSSITNEPSLSFSTIPVSSYTLGAT